MAHHLKKTELAFVGHAELWPFRVPRSLQQILWIVGQGSSDSDPMQNWSKEFFSTDGIKPGSKIVLSRSNIIFIFC